MTTIREMVAHRDHTDTQRDCEPCRDESTAIAHLRGHCHNSAECPICKAEVRAHRAERELDRIISG